MLQWKNASDLKDVLASQQEIPNEEDAAGAKKRQRPAD